jgi:citrate synthase
MIYKKTELRDIQPLWSDTSDPRVALLRAALRQIIAVAEGTNHINAAVAIAKAALEEPK